jgi:heat shock protein HslJ
MVPPFSTMRLSMTAFRLAAILTALAIAPAAYAQTGARGRAAASAPAQNTNVPQPKQEKIFPVGASWVAVSLNGKPFSGDRPGFTLDQQFRARGFGGCNTFSATAYPLREQTLAVGPFALTKKTCDKAVMALEHAFLVALRTSGKWDLEGSTLIIKTQSGDLRLERAL